VSKYCLSVGLLIFALTTPAASAAPQRDGVYLVNDLAFAREEARKSGKPIFVVFRCEV
jgi:hypothetical protein